VLVDQEKGDWHFVSQSPFFYLAHFVTLFHLAGRMDYRLSQHSFRARMIDPFAMAS
jgi:hypothetical protein